MRYPVKSMQGEAVAEIFVQYAGLVGDRAYAFVDLSKKGNFPWLTARQLPELLRYQPRFKHTIAVAQAFPHLTQFDLEVVTPSGENLPIQSQALLLELATKSEKQIELRFSEAGMQDARPVSLLSLQSIDQLAKDLAQPIDPLRFRMNFYVHWDNEQAHYEDTLVGQKVQIGERLLLEINKKDPRCTIVTIDPTTTKKSPIIHRHLLQQLENCFGVYAVVIREGIVKADDPIYLV